MQYKKVDMEDLINISLAMDELEGALKDAVKDAPAGVKKNVLDCINFTYKDVTDRLDQYL